MDFRVYFLLIAALVVLHVPELKNGIILVGYIICEVIDKRISQKTKQTARDSSPAPLALIIPIHSYRI